MNAMTMQEQAENSELPFNILTDLASPAAWSKIAHEARNDTPQLDEVFSMIERREVIDTNGKNVKLKDGDITLEQAELLFYLIHEIKPILSVEMGFANGLAASVMTTAHMLNGLNGGHVPIEDQAKLVNDGIGHHTMERLELTGYQIMEHEPALVLPQMLLQQLNQGLKLVYFNGARTFEEQMMEYYYMNRLLNEGGVLAINTANAARRELVDFIRRDRHDYAIRALSCGITLVQKPAVTALAQHAASVKH